MKGYGTLFEAALAAILGGYAHQCGKKEAQAFVIELEDGSFVGHVESESEGMIREGTELIVTPTGMKPASEWLNQFFKKGLGEEEPELSEKILASPGYRFPEGVKVVATRRNETPAKVGRPLSDDELGVWLQPYTARIRMWGCYITPALWEALHKAGSIPRLFDTLAEKGVQVKGYGTVWEAVAAVVAADYCDERGEGTIVTLKDGSFAGLVTDEGTLDERMAGEQRERGAELMLTPAGIGEAPASFNAWWNADRSVTAPYPLNITEVLASPAFRMPEGIELALTQDGNTAPELASSRRRGVWMYPYSFPGAWYFYVTRPLTRELLGAKAGEW